MLKALIVGMLLMSGAAGAELISAYRAGEITVMAPRRGLAHRYHVVKADDPQGFQNALTYQWGAALLPLGGAAFFWRLERKSEKHDPFSPRYAGNEAFDKSGDDKP